MDDAEGIRLIEMLCARLCHDLISPVTAVNHGVELLEELGTGGADDAFALIAQSGRTAAARLTLFRLAFGTSGALASLTEHDAASAAMDWFDGGRVRLSWQPTSEPAPTGLFRLILCLLLIAEEALPTGGLVRVGRSGTAAEVEAEGPRVELRPEVQAVFAGRDGPDGLTPRSVVARLIGPMAARHGFRFGLSDSAPGRLVLSVERSG